MSPRPKNPPPDRRQEILDAALQVFAEKGYAAATNADIARQAGVTAAALYYYFPSKADLFKAVVAGRKSVIQAPMEEMAESLLELPPEVVLPMIVQSLISFMSDEKTQAVMRIVLAEAPRNPEILDAYQNHAIGQMVPLMLKYLQHQIDLGRLKPMNPMLTALLVNGPLVAAIILRDIIKVEFAGRLTNEEITQGIIDLILPGMIVQHKE